MNLNSERIALEVINQLREAGSWTGKTHVIKTLFLAKELYKLKLPFEFILYKHGPYSFDAEDSLAAMEVYGYAQQIDTVPGYGRSFKQGSRAEVLTSRSVLSPSDQQKIENLCHALASYNVRELEGIATACWVQNHESITEEQQIAQRLHELKPHIPVEEALERVKVLRALPVAS